MRLTLDDLDLDVGRRTRLHRLLYVYGPGAGTLMLMPIDQGLEHGPRDFFDNPAAKDPETILSITHEGGFSGIVFHLGLAEKYMRRWAGRIPLILKLNGKTDIPSDKAAFSAPKRTATGCRSSSGPTRAARPSSKRGGATASTP